MYRITLPCHRHEEQWGERATAKKEKEATCLNVFPLELLRPRPGAAAAAAASPPDVTRDEQTCFTRRRRRLFCFFFCFLISVASSPSPPLEHLHHGALA